MTSRPVAFARGLLTAALVWGVGSLLTVVAFRVLGASTTIVVSGQGDRAQIVWWGAHAFFACLGGLLGVAIGGLSLTRERLARPGAATSALGVPILLAGGAVLAGLASTHRVSGDLAFACGVGLLTGVVGGAVYVLQIGLPDAGYRSYPAVRRAGQSWEPLTRSRARRAVALVLLAGSLLVCRPAALSSPSAAASAATDPVRVLVVLDVSGSMRRSDGNGARLLDGARNALAELVYSLPEDTEVGLRVYGSEYAGTDRARSCRDTRLVVPVGPLDPGRIVAAANRLKPTGDTPIGVSLKYAASDLRASAPGKRGVIVLISDGEDNCSAPESPPCQVVGGLQEQGFKVRIETVGVALAGNRAARRALECISGRTGGLYYDARDAPALSAALERISSEALGRLGRGREVPGSARLSRAPLITPGTYRTTLRPGQKTWYRFKAISGERPRLLATVEGVASLRVPKTVRDCPAWRAELHNPYGEGATYPPYGNSGAFDGVGIGTTGASTTTRVRPYSKGIDFTGTWAIQLSLARDTAKTCSAFLPPGRSFRTRFALQIDEPAARSRRPAGDVTATPSPSGTPSPETSATEQYTTPARPQETPSWVLPVTAVGVVLLLGAIGAAVLSIRRRRRRGW